jgi:hypothetical protein
MTVKEMSEAIEKYCDGQGSCEHCRMNELVGNGYRSCHSYEAGEEASEAVIVENYKFLFGDPEVPASESTPDSEEVPAHDSVNHPSHYCQEGSMECIDEMVAVFGSEAVMHFCLLNVWKYRKRAVFKNGEEDLKKSDWYMKKYIELKGDL